MLQPAITSRVRFSDSERFSWKKNAEDEKTSEKVPILVILPLIVLSSFSFSPLSRSSSSSFAYFWFLCDRQPSLNEWCCSDCSGCLRALSLAEVKFPDLKEGNVSVILLLVLVLPLLPVFFSSLPFCCYHHLTSSLLLLLLLFSPFSFSRLLLVPLLDPFLSSLMLPLISGASWSSARTARNVWEVLTPVVGMSIKQLSNCTGTRSWSGTCTSTWMSPDGWEWVRRMRRGSDEG